MENQLKQFFQLPVKPNLEKGKSILARLAKRSSWMEKDLNQVIELMDGVIEIWNLNAGLLARYELRSNMHEQILKLVEADLAATIKTEFKDLYDVDPEDSPEVRSKKISDAIDREFNQAMAEAKINIEITR